MGFLDACKNEEDPIKNERARVVTSLFINISDAQGQLTPKKIRSKLKALEWSQHFSHYKFMGIFPNTQGQVTHKSLVGSY